MNSEQMWEGKDFCFKVEAIDRKRIALRIWSSKEIRLWIQDVKVFCNEEPIAVPKTPANVDLNNSYKIVSIEPEDVDCLACTTVTFQIADKTAGKRYKCSALLKKSQADRRKYHCEEICF